jgi:hypothetical protein
VFNLINITHLSPILPPKLKLERRTNSTSRSETNLDHQYSTTFRHNNSTTPSVSVLKLLRSSTVYICTLVQTPKRTLRTETTPETGTHFTLWYATNLDQRYNNPNDKIKQLLTTHNSHQSPRVFNLIKTARLSPILPSKLKLERRTNSTSRSETNSDHHNSITFRHNNSPTPSETDKKHSQNLTWNQKTHQQAPFRTLEHHISDQNYRARYKHIYHP